MPTEVSQVCVPKRHLHYQVDKGSLAPRRICNGPTILSLGWQGSSRCACSISDSYRYQNFQIFVFPYTTFLNSKTKWQRQRAKVCNSSNRLSFSSLKDVGTFPNLTHTRSALHPLPRRPPSHIAQHQHRQVAQGRPAAARVRRRPPLRPGPAPQRWRHQEVQARPQGRPEHQGPQAPRARPREGRGDRRQDVQQGPQEQEVRRQHRPPQEGLGRHQRAGGRRGRRGEQVRGAGGR